MGKVYDALRRAEEQRARRAQETAPGEILGRVAPPETPAAPPRELAPSPERRSLWRRLVGRRDRVAESTSALNKRRIALLQPESHVAEQFRTLRARLDAITASHPLRTIGVTSALAEEGKTMSAVNLALVSSMSVGRRVLLVDCDLRRPAIHRSLGLLPNAGLGEVLSGRAEAQDAIVKVDGTELEVLAVRGLPSNPAELLASERMRALVVELAGRYDRIILDLPPALGLPDAKTVSEVCDGTLFVVRAGRSTQQDVETALDVLDRRRILGFVLNETEAEAARYDYRS
jgi:protein-tyrosine kinase